MKKTIQSIEAGGEIAVIFKRQLLLLKGGGTIKKNKPKGD